MMKISSGFTKEVARGEPIGASTRQDPPGRDGQTGEKRQTEEAICPACQYARPVDRAEVGLHFKPGHEESHNTRGPPRGSHQTRQRGRCQQKQDGGIGELQSRSSGGHDF